MSEFKWFKSLVTGKTGRYPAHYGERPSFVEIDPDDAAVLDFLVEPETTEDPDLFDDNEGDEDTETEDE